MRRRINRLQQRPLDQKGVAVELLPRLGAIDAAGGVEDAQFEDLPRVVPFVDRVADIQAFVALQANQVGIECGGRGRGERRLANPGFALEEQRPLQLERQEQRHRERAVGDVVLFGEAPLKVVDGPGCHGGECIKRAWVA